MIELQHLEKKYGRRTAIHDLTMTLASGKIYGFLGPNGAGKSTTMNIITGYLGADSGDVIVNGCSIRKNPSKVKQQIGYLPELPPLYTEMRVREYLSFSAELKGIKKNFRSEAVKEIMVRTGLSEVQNSLIRNLSKGYRQRVGLAQAILGYPDVLILDEPTVGLDPQQIREIRALIRSLKNRHTIIISSHILSEISEICDEVFIISHGRLVAEDTPEHLERSLRGRQELSVAVQGSEENVRALNNLPHMESCTISQDPNNGQYLIRILAEPDTDLRKEVSLFCVNHDLLVLGMQEDTNSLEDVFIRLTQQEDQELSQSADSLIFGRPTRADRRQARRARASARRSAKTAASKTDTEASASRSKPDPGTDAADHHAKAKKEEN